MVYDSRDTKTKKIWILAGEESGDMYGAQVVKELNALAPNLIIQGMGGREMRNSGVEILVDSSELGVVGVFEVFKNIHTFLRIFKQLVCLAKEKRPDLVLLIDYPGFNLRFAKKMKPLGIKIFYYISPQVWAWKSSRIPVIAQHVAKMLVIFPFEKELYQSVNLDTSFVGHPLLDVMKSKINKDMKRESNLILLLPGSRINEIDRLLHPMILTACQLYEKNPKFQFMIAVPRAKIEERAEQILTMLKADQSNFPSIKIVVGETEKWMQKAVVGIAASGTITVQSAIFGLPLVVIYKVNYFTYLLGKLLVKVPYITMVNIIAGDCVYEEFIQEQVTPTNLVEAIYKILPGGERREAVLKEMQEVLKKLGSCGNASRNVAETMVTELTR